MEVFLPTLPANLTDRGLKVQLTRAIETLNIYDWSCEKPRKKSIGFITFLRPVEGQRFLQHYAGRNSKAQLEILGTVVHCRPSNKSPNPYLLKSLTKSAEDKLKAQQ